MNRIAVGRKRLSVLLWALLVGWPGMTARADEGPGITVSGTGIAEAMPEVVELSATVQGTAQLAGEAVEKYRDNKRRVIKSLDGLNIKGMTVVGSGLSVNSGTPPNPMAAFQAGQANKPKVADKVAVQEQLTITLSGVDTMSADNLLQALTRIVDVAKDAGVAIGPGPQSMIEAQLSGSKPAALATFKLTNTDKLRQQAYAAALTHARAKAEHLAQLAGVQLGDIVSIREGTPDSPDDKGGGGIAGYMALFGRAMGSKPENTSAELHNIPVTVNLNVQFEIVKKK